MSKVLTVSIHSQSMMATETSQIGQSSTSPRRDRFSLALSPPPLVSPVRTTSFSKAAANNNDNRPTQDPPATQSFQRFSRGIFYVDGGPLSHWDKSNFQPERDESCRVVYKPKGGSEFYQKHLRREDYLVMRRSTIEQPFFSKYNRFYPKKGHFCCKACGNPLYSHKAKLKREDGWPAFGACVDGAIGMTTIEERQQRQERERIAATRIQAFVRGCLTRETISEKIALLIEKVTKLEEELEIEEEEFNDMSSSSAPMKARMSRASIPLFANLSLHSLDEFSFSDGNSSSSSFASFGDESDHDTVATDNKAKKQEENKKAKGKSIASFAATAAVKRTQDKEIKDAEANEWNELLIDIHCHRCKSHLGNIFEEENLGQDGIKKYKERHRVNGRSMKYVEDDLPKRINADSSLLFANQSQRRLMGLKPAEPETKEPEFLYAKPRTSFFVSPRAKRKKKLAESFQSPASRPKPGVGVRLVSFQSPVGSPSPRHRLSSKQKKLENMFLNRSVH